MSIKELFNTKNTNNIYYALRAGLPSWITQCSELCNSVSQFFQNCFTPFSSSQSGKANCESAFVEKVTKTATRLAAHILTKLNPSSGFPDGLSPGERKADAGKPKG